MIAVALIVIAGVALAPQTDDLTFSKSQQVVAQGNKEKEVAAVLTLTSSSLRVTRKKAEPIDIAFTEIGSITYERRVSDRVIGHGNETAHYLVVQFRKGDRGDFVNLHLDKDDASRFVNNLEARSGKRIDKLNVES
jgi:hypothetical protein